MKKVIRKSAEIVAECLSDTEEMEIAEKNPEMTSEENGDSIKLRRKKNKTSREATEKPTTVLGQKEEPKRDKIQTKQKEYNYRQNGFDCKTYFERETQQKRDSHNMYKHRSFITFYNENIDIEKRITK